MILFDISPLAGGVGIGIFIVFLLIGAAVAFIAYKMLKKTVKTAIRMVIVAVILLIAIIGGIATLVIVGTSGSGSKAPIKKTR